MSSYFDTRIPGRRLLHSPGPSPIPDPVLHAMSVQPMDLADPRVDANIATVEEGLKRLLGQAQGDVFLYAANGHGVWEASIENLAAPGQAVLVPGTGHFSDGWATQAEALGRVVVRTPWREGWPIDAEAVEQALRDDRAHTIRAVFAVHTDTASGITSDIPALRRALDAARHPALLVADVVASAGCSPFEMDAWGVDVALGASQKGLMCPPGLGFLAVNPRAFVHAQQTSAPRAYWDFVSRQHAVSYRKFFGTPPMNLLFGMEAALGLIFQEGLAAVHRRHARLAAAVQAAVAAWREGGAVYFVAQVPATRSATVTSIAVRPGAFDIDALRSVARERFQVAVAGGLGPFAGRAFRIGHLGDSNPALILGAIAGVEGALRTLGVPVDAGTGQGGTQRALLSLIDNTEETTP
jgi:alanine-glyoxylate transaminase / serine-glyoxylate transaminase / serine-pyruvate transaminase